MSWYTDEQGRKRPITKRRRQSYELPNLVISSNVYKTISLDPTIFIHPTDLAYTLLVKDGLKSGSRISLKTSQRDKFEKFLTDNNILFVVEPSKYSSEYTIGRTKENIDRILNSLGNTYELGLALGYPESAVEYASKQNEFLGKRLFIYDPNDENASLIHKQWSNHLMNKYGISYD